MVVYEDESGLVAPLVIFVVGLAVITFLYMFTSPLFDEMINSYNTVVTSTGYMTQASADTVDTIRIAITYFPVVIVFALTLAFLIDAMREKRGDV